MIGSSEGKQLPAMFLAHAADVLGDTNSGLSGSNIARLLRGFGMELGVQVPHSIYPFDAPNKRTALLDNLVPFSASQQYRIIRELCDHPSFPPIPNPERQKIKIQLATTYAGFAAPSTVGTISEDLIEKTRHWLEDCSAARDVYVSALDKYAAGVFTRNLLDDLRLALELLLKRTFDNDKSLENQISTLGGFIKTRGGSPQLGNMFAKLVDYYCTYQNTYVKHGDTVKEPEIEFILEITSTFMKHVIRVNHG
jgi:hypothetical protein